MAGVAVGPRSAGSTPGPACFGQGGSEPTVTDANLVLGYLDADTYHGGEFPLDQRRAERAIERRIAKPLGIDTVAAARSIRRVVDRQMGDEIFKEVALKGYDPAALHRLQLRRRRPAARVRLRGRRWGPERRRAAALVDLLGLRSSRPGALARLREERVVSCSSTR